jgi:hypothetical protein
MGEANKRLIRFGPYGGLLLKAVVVFVAFVGGMIAVTGFMHWAIPQFPLIAIKALGWFLPGFAVGYLFMRWRVLRLVSASDGEAAAAALNQRL